MVFLLACALLAIDTASACLLDNLTLIQLHLVGCGNITGAAYVGSEQVINQLDEQINILTKLSVQHYNLKQQLNQSLDATTHISQQVELLEHHLDAYTAILNISKEDVPINDSSGLCFNEQQVRKQQMKIKCFLEHLHKFEQWIMCYFPTIVIFEVVFVFLGNALVLYAIIKHKDMKNKPNALMLNVAFADILYAISYSIIEHYRLKWFFVPGKYCTFAMFRLMIQVFFSGFSGYSVCLLSLMRYHAASGDSPQYLRMQNLILLIVAVWIVPGLYAIILSLVIACPYKQRIEGVIVNSIVLYISPMLIVVVSYLATARIIRRSLKILQENEGQRHSTERGGYVTIFLSVVFCVSNLPLHLCSWFDCSINCFDSYEVSFLMNSALNPLALYIGGEKFRQHFNEYFYWCFQKISYALHLGSHQSQSS